jgi:hypothetical protein
MWPVEQRIVRIGTVVLCAALLWPEQPVQAQFTQGPKLVGPNAIGAAGQGSSVALSADSSWVIVGGPDDSGAIGAVWFFVRSNRTWVPFQKLSATDAVGPAQQGWSVAMSADGTTAIVGGPGDSNLVGAAWVFTRSGGVWSPQATKLGASDAVGQARQGFSVALSADGNTAIVGGFFDNSGVGAAWVFTRSGGMWSQQAKLIGSNAIGKAKQGFSVALSADGNTAIVGGPCDSFPSDCNSTGGAGAAWVFTRSGGMWSQQGQKLVGSNAVGNADQGTSVALSADGNTAIVGGFLDNSSAGAAWVFTRSGGMWSQQGNKLFASDAIGSNVQQGFSVALSADGNTAIVGGFGDNSRAGAAWVFTRSGGMWSQQEKLFANNADGNAEQGASVALFCNAAIVGGPEDSSAGGGAAWVFVRPATATHDFSCDSLSDILWRNTNGGIAMWLMNGATVTSSFGLGNVPTDWSIVGQRDFNGDGFADILWRNTNGGIAMWLMNGATITSSLGLGNLPSNWVIAGTGDFNGDGKGDILWRDNNSGGIAQWTMNGGTILFSLGVGNVPTNWVIAGIGDFNGDGMADVLWRDNNSGGVVIWLMNGASILSALGVGNVPLNWVIAATGDFNGDGMADILWRDNNSGGVAMWLMNGGTVTSSLGIGNVPNNWQIAQTGDYNGDGMSDVLWRDSNSGGVAMWLMNGATVTSSLAVGNVPTDWQIQGQNAD